MLKEPIARVSRGLRSIRSGGALYIFTLLLALILGGCAPSTTTQLPPATAMAVKAAVPATAAPPETVAPTAVPQPTAAATTQPTANTQPAANADLAVTVIHTNDVDGETDPCG